MPLLCPLWADPPSPGHRRPFWMAPYSSGIGAVTPIPIPIQWSLGGGIPLRFWFGFTFQSLYLAKVFVTTMNLPIREGQRYPALIAPR